MATVPVFIVPDQTVYSRTPLLRQLFSDPLFEVTTLEPSVNKRVYPSDEDYRKSQEAELFFYSLQKARAEHPDSYVIIIKNTSTSASDANTVAALVRRTMAVEFDICYLSKWLDSCQLYKRAARSCDDMEVLPIQLVRTQRPQGLQAVLISPKGRDILLGIKSMANNHDFRPGSDLAQTVTSEIASGNLRAIATVPNLFDFDIIFNVTSNSDYLKVDECAVVGTGVTTTPPDDTPTSFQWLWIVLLIVFAFLLVFALWRLGPRPRTVPASGACATAAPSSACAV